MNKTKFFILGIGASIIAGCVKQQIVEPLTLPNGKPGLIVNCSGYGLPECFKAAGEACPNGYYIYERTIGENTETVIAVEKPSDWKSSVGDGYLERRYKDKYMIVSCR